jgi:diguanylate cyclase (GGDEF)-like protein/PAS domain S-box-containing protein
MRSLRRARLRHKVEAHRSRLRVVAAAQRGIFADGVDADRVLLSVATWALAIADCDVAIIAIPDGNELVYRSVVGGDSVVVGSRVPIAETHTGRCLVTNLPIVFADPDAGGSSLAVPLLSADPAIPVGVLQVNSTRPRAFDNDDVVALTVVAQIARKALTESAVLAELQTSEARYRTLVDHLPETAVMVFDTDLRLEMVAGPGTRTWRYAERNVTPGLLLEQIVSPGELALLRPHYQAALDGAGSRLDYRSVLGLDLEVDAAPMVDSDGEIRHVLVMVADVTARKAVDRALRIAEQHYRTAFDAAPVGMAQQSLTGEFQSVNRALCELIGYTPEELIGLSHEAVTDPGGHEQASATLRSMIDDDLGTWSSDGQLIHSDGHKVWVNQSTIVVRDLHGAPTHLLSHYLDITDRKQLDSQLRHLAEHDPLTGLHNRRSFEVELGLLAASIVRNGPSGALLVLDLDHFKLVNDTLGHSAGDELIVSLADVLRRRLRSTDVIARLGGDEFAVLLASTTAEHAQLVANGLLEAIREEVRVVSNGVPRRLTTSIGIALFDRPGLDPAAVLINADLTMFEAKAAGGDRFAIHRSNGQALRPLSRTSTSPVS